MVLSKLDAIDGPIDRTWTTSLRQDIRFAYMQYHSNLNYVVDIKVAALPITDTTMLRITGPFDDPPDSSRIRSRFVPPSSPQQSAISASSTTTLSQQQHTTSSNSIAPTSSLSPAFHLQRESLPPYPRARDSSTSNVFGLGSPTVNSIKSDTINVLASQFESRPLPYAVVLDADPVDYHATANYPHDTPLPVSLPSSIPISSIPISIANPADHKLMQYSSNMKQDSQIQSLVSSQGSLSMYPISLQADPPVPMAPVSMQVPSNTIRRVAPVLVNTENKRVHFPTN